MLICEPVVTSSSQTVASITVENLFQFPLVTVWCVLWSVRVVGPYFFENECFVLLYILNNIDLKNVYFQQNSATCQRSNETVGPLREKFLDCVITQSGDRMI